MPRCSVRARCDNRPDSDTDIMIDIAPAADISSYDYPGLKRYVAKLLELATFTGMIMMM